MFGLAFRHRSMHFTLAIHNRMMIGYFLSFFPMLMIGQIHDGTILFATFWLLSRMMQIDTIGFSFVSSLHDSVVFRDGRRDSKDVGFDILVYLIGNYVNFVENWLELFIRLLAWLGIGKFTIYVVFQVLVC